MQRFYIILLCFFALNLTSVNAEGIVFFDGTLNEAMVKAKKEKKLVFVDAWATWCGPCKAMNRNTFPVGSVGAYMNKHFVSVKIDVEKGEGPSFANKYQITGMPTLLFLDYQGAVVHRVMGYRGPKELLTEAKQAKNPSVNQSMLQLYYEEGTNDPGILYNYAINQAESDEDYREAAGRYFATQEEKALLNEQNWNAIQLLTTQIDSREFQYLLSKQKKYEKLYGEAAVMEKIESVLRNYVVKAKLLNQRALYEEAIDVANSLKDGALISDKLSMEYAEAMEDWGDYLLRAETYLDNHEVTDPAMLNKIAEKFFAYAKSEQQLNKAVEWSRQATALDNAWYTNRVYAFLLEKVGRTGDARKIAYKALTLGEREGKDVSDLRDLIERL